MSTTIKDIADRLNISYATVSRALNGRYGVNPRTREKVLAAAKKLHYTPNAVARGLVTRQTMTLGLIIPDITNPFFPWVARGVEDRAAEAGYSILLCNTNWDKKREERYLSLFKEKRVDGIILAPVSPGEKRAGKRAGLPLVYMSDTRRDSNISSVTIDNVLGGYTAVSYLITMGYKRIGFFGAVEDELTSAERYQGYRKALDEAGRPNYDRYVRYGDYRNTTGSHLINSMISEGDYPDAVFAVNDLFALGVIQGVKEAGLSVPGDVAVVGFDDIPFASFPEVMLTTMAQPKYEMGRMAVDLLLEEIDDPARHRGREIVLEPELIIRRTA